jgi:hypothetical protein
MKSITSRYGNTQEHEFIEDRLDRLRESSLHYVVDIKEMRKLFKKKEVKQKETILYNKRVNAPNGVAFKVGDEYFLVKSGKLLKFFSERVFISWGLDFREVGPDSLKHLKRAGTIGFRDGSLIQNFVDGKMYLVSDNKRRLITDPDLLVLYGPAVVASEAEINLQDEGEQINGV